MAGIGYNAGQARTPFTSPRTLSVFRIQGMQLESSAHLSKELFIHDCSACQRYLYMLNMFCQYIYLRMYVIPADL